MMFFPVFQVCVVGMLSSCGIVIDNHPFSNQTACQISIRDFMTDAREFYLQQKPQFKDQELEIGGACMSKEEIDKARSGK